MTPQDINNLVAEVKTSLATLQNSHGEVKGLAPIVTGLKSQMDKLTGLPEELGTLKSVIGDLQRSLDQTKREAIAARMASQTLRAGQAVTDDCAKFMAAVWIRAGFIQKAFDGLGGSQRESLAIAASDVLGETINAKTALSSSDIPLPTQFQSQVVELVFKYGQARQYATVFPLGTATVKLPKLGTDPAFGFIARSGTVTEKSPTISFVTFTPLKAGGLIRLPSEIDADSIVNLGQFIARYVARQMAKWEDTVLFNADGSTSTYGDGGSYKITGAATQAATDGAQVTLASTKTKPSDITLTNMRDLRAQPTGAVLGDAAYYAHPTMDSLFATYNTSATVMPYLRNGPNGMPTLDGFPVRWVPVMPVYGTSATAGANQVLFGDLSYTYLGVRSGIDFQTSRDAAFATDEILLRALERFDVQSMGTKSIAVLTLAAS